MILEASPPTLTPSDREVHRGPRKHPPSVERNRSKEPARNPPLPQTASVPQEGSARVQPHSPIWVPL